MVETTLLANAIFGLVTAIVYASVGLRVNERSVSAEARSASRSFAIWWMGLGAITAAGSVLSVAGALGSSDLSLHLSITYMLLLALCIAFVGLLYYLLYVYTGRRNLLYPIAGLYFLYFALLVYYVDASGPAGVEVTKWQTRVFYAHQITSGPVFYAVLLGLLVPPTLGAIAYLSLYFRVGEKAQKRRILLVAGSIAIWFGAIFMASSFGISGSTSPWAFGLTVGDVWQVVSRLIGLAAASVIYVAYAPPASGRRQGEMQDPTGGAGERAIQMERPGLRPQSLAGASSASGILQDGARPVTRACDRCFAILHAAGVA
ncbi:MAG: hypothetical protein HY556_02975 [Euryarchaeota archaeon]|nr:hypothetical protein [Euryarchaeota archaeon]